MDPARLTTTPEGIVLAGLTSIAMGMTMLLSGRSRRSKKGSTAAWVLFLLLAAGVPAAVLLGQPAERWVPVLLLTVLLGFGLAIRSQAGLIVRQTLCRLCSNHALQALALIGLGFGSIIGFYHWTDSMAESWSEMAAEGEMEDKPAFSEYSPVAQTDLGSTLAFHLPVSLEGDAERARAEERGLLRRGMPLHAIRTSPASSETNCHGWVFTGGTCWVESIQVENILMENGYVEVFAPRKDDLIVYRDDDGIVLHTGIVRLVENGQVIVESKWGIGGRYLHRPDGVGYSHEWQYYRTSRGTHVLNQLQIPRSADSIPVASIAPIS